MLRSEDSSDAVLQRENDSSKDKPNILDIFMIQVDCEIFTKKLQNSLIAVF